MSGNKKQIKPDQQVLDQLENGECSAEFAIEILTKVIAGLREENEKQKETIKRENAFVDLLEQIMGEGNLRGYHEDAYEDLASEFYGDCD